MTEHNEIDEQEMENTVITLTNVAMLGANSCPGCAAKALRLALKDVEEQVFEELGRIQ